MEVTHETAKSNDPKGFDQNKLIERFGSKVITTTLLERIKKICKVDKIHPFLTRGIFFSHRDLDILLNKVEAGKTPYIYTGRGPSTEAMHIGHLIPFYFTKYLQQLFNAMVYIQITDDEKFLFKGEYSLEEYYHLGIENIKDILACGFDHDKTKIFIDTKYIDKLYPNAVKIANKITNNQMRAAFGFKGEDNIGKSFFPVIQMSPAIPTTFGLDKKTPCIIPCAIDQDPYFRVLRDIAPRLKSSKPIIIHSTFMPSLNGCQEKMSSSDPTTAIFLTDSPKRVKSKISRAFSGGRETVEEHRELGGVPEVDVAFRYLTCFMEDDEQLNRIEEAYRSGKMLSGELKKLAIDLITKIVINHQNERDKIEYDTIEHYLLHTISPPSPA